MFGFCWDRVFIYLCICYCEVGMGLLWFCFLGDSDVGILFFIVLLRGYFWED